MVSLQGKRIFYIEDDIKNRSIVQMILEREGVNFGFERWGRDATIPALQAFGHIDLILLDLMFPGNISGYDIFERIREDPEFNGVPIVAISAADAAIEMPKTRDLGFDGYISKPISLSSFGSIIAELLEGKMVWHA